MYASIFWPSPLFLLVKVVMMILFITACALFAYYCIKMYPMTLMNCDPLSRPVCNDSARVGVIVWPSCTKSDSDINIKAVIFIVGEKADPCFWSSRLPISSQWVKIKPLFVAINLRGRIWANQGPPCVTTQIGRTVLSVGDQWVQGICSLVDDNEPELLVDLHTETDLGEWCVPVSR